MVFLPFGVDVVNEDIAICVLDTVDREPLGFLKEGAPGYTRLSSSSKGDSRQGQVDFIDQVQFQKAVS